MPRYYFDAYDQSDLTRDEEGIHCDLRSEIQERAIDALPDMARDALPNGPNHDFRIQVRDESDRVVFRATLTLTSVWFEGGPAR